MTQEETALARARRLHEEPNDYEFQALDAILSHLEEQPSNVELAKLIQEQARYLAALTDELRNHKAASAVPKITQAQGWDEGLNPPMVGEPWREAGSQPITASPTTACLSDAAAAFMTPAMLESSLLLQHVIESGLAELGSVSLTRQPECHCPLCESMLALGADQITLTSAKLASSPSAAPPFRVD